MHKVEIGNFVIWHSGRFVSVANTIDGLHRKAVADISDSLISNYGIRLRNGKARLTAFSEVAKNRIQSLINHALTTK